MKKRNLSLVLSAALVTMSMAACSSSSGTATTAAASEAATTAAETQESTASETTAETSASSGTDSSSGSGTTWWVQQTYEKIVPQTDNMDTYGVHVGRPQPDTPACQPVVDKALPDFVPAYGPDELTGSKIMKCSDVLAYICHDYLDKFKTYYPNVNIDLSEPYKGSAGAQELIAGTVDMVMVSREPRPNEYPDFEAAFGYPMSVVPVQGGSFNHFGWLDAMCFVVNKNNPIESLSMSDIDSIFSTSHYRGGKDVTTWGDLGVTGEWADKTITPYAVTHWNGFEEFIRIRCLDKLDGDPGDNLFATQGTFREDMQFSEKIFDQAKHVAEDETGIAYTGVAYVDEDVKILPIRLDDGTLVSPTLENVCDASWPLSRLCYLNYNKDPNGDWDPVIREFLRFMLSKQAAEIAAEQNIFIPLTAKQANQARDIAGLPHEDYTLTVNGAEVASDNVPIRYNYAGLKDVTMVPFFDTLDALGATYSYDTTEKQYNITCGDIQSVVKIGSGFINVGDTEKQLSLNSKNWDGCTYMPVDGIDYICGTTNTVNDTDKTVAFTK